MTVPIATDLLLDAVERIGEGVTEVLDGLSTTQLLTRVDPDANSIAWLIWHLTRVEDDHFAGVVGRPVEGQVWLIGGWYEQYGLPYPASDHGYGHTSAQVGEFRLADPSLLLGYHQAVHAETRAIIRSLDADDFDVIVDRSWDPPVTAAVRLVSVINDATQHVGQAAFLRGLLERRDAGRTPVRGVRPDR